MDVIKKEFYDKGYSKEGTMMFVQGINLEPRISFENTL